LIAFPILDYQSRRGPLIVVDGHFGSPSGKEKPSNTDVKELANG